MLLEKAYLGFTYYWYVSSGAIMVYVRGEILLSVTSGSLSNAFPHPKAADFLIYFKKWM